eukprot:1131941_1
MLQFVKEHAKRQPKVKDQCNDSKCEYNALRIESSEEMFFKMDMNLMNKSELAHIADFHPKLNEVLHAMLRKNQHKTTYRRQHAKVIKERETLAMLHTNSFNKCDQPISSCSSIQRIISYLDQYKRTKLTDIKTVMLVNLNAQDTVLLTNGSNPDTMNALESAFVIPDATGVR